MYLGEHVYFSELLGVRFPYSPRIQVTTGPCGNVSKVTTYKNESTDFESEKLTGIQFELTLPLTGLLHGQLPRPIKPQFSYLSNGITIPASLL